MTNLDSQEERQRLIVLYAAMSDLELQKVAAEAYDLTDDASQALAAEIQRRGLGIALAGDPGFDEVEGSEIVTVRQYRDLFEAQLAKGMLESAGIECFLADENIVRMNWYISNLVGGLRLQVRPDDAEAAREILDQPMPENFDIEGVDQYEQPRCPNCQSLDISFEETNKGIVLGAVWFAGIPLPIRRDRWKCHSCGRAWQETE